MNASLNAFQIDSLLRILREHRKAIGYTLDYLKEIYPFVSMHRILMKDDHMLTIEHQMRLNPNIQQVVKKEILKLLKAGIIYPISDSKWVSPIHVVPKKEGTTVVKNENNELLPIMTVMRWSMCIDY